MAPNITSLLRVQIERSARTGKAEEAMSLLRQFLEMERLGKSERLIDEEGRSGKQAKVICFPGALKAV